MNQKSNNTITASRMGSLLRCPRAHYWQYEVGLVREAKGIALRIGSARARVLEAWNNGNEPEACLQHGCDPAEDLNEYTVAMIAGLFEGYVKRWGEERVVAKLYPETPFRYPLDKAKAFDVAGVMDALGSLIDGRSVLVESKTTGDRLAPESNFWLRLRFNPQVNQYILAARRLGWDVAMVIYDVTRKPSIKPKTVPVLDSGGRKIVLVAATGRRAMVFRKKSPPRFAKSGSEAKGWAIKTRIETPTEFRDRLAADCAARPDFYFARREVAVLDDELQAFEIQRLALGRMIVHFRDGQAKSKAPEDAWPRAVSEMNCRFCSYQSFCLLNISVDTNQPPDGFGVKPFNPELERSPDASPDEQVQDAV